MQNSTLIRLLGSISAIALSVPVAAQTVTDSQAPTAASPEGTSDSEASVAEIVVTGSHIKALGYTAPTPVTVLDTDELVRKAPSNLPDALNQLPQFQGSINQNMQADLGSTKVRSGNYLDIRALGPQRVLILMNGRRVPPTSNNGATDTNLIPQMLIKRVDVVTGGASATYGSDAVSGVVNFVLDEKFKGLKLNVQSGVSTYHDDGSYKIAGAFGSSFLDDRLHVLLSGEYYHSDGISDRSSRHTSSGENSSSGMTIAGFGTPASPFYYVSGARLNFTTFNGVVTSPGQLAGKQFRQDGTLIAFNPGTSIPGRAGYGLGSDGIIWPSKEYTGVPSLTTRQAFGRVAYDLADNVTMFADASYNTGSNSDKGLPFTTPGSGSIIFAENAFLQPSVASLMAPGSSIRVARQFREWAPLSSTQKSRSFTLNAGLTGEFDSTTNWQVHYTHGFSRFITNAESLDTRRYFAATDAVRNSSGRIVCNVTLTNPGLMNDCVPLNVIGENSADPAAIAFVKGVSHWQADNKMDLVAANISAQPLSLWAGPISIALGGEYRHQSLVQTSNSDPAVPVDFTGLRGVTSTNFFTGLNVGTGAGSYNVTELYGEVAVPLAKDSAIGDLDVNGAVRYTHYSTSGTTTTWKVGGSYTPISDIRFRATLSRDVRAPSLFELFAGKQQTGSPLTDRHTNTSSLTKVISSGNLDLKPEVARTLTFGAVFTPRFIPGLHLSIDYYRINIKDAIAQPFTYIQLADLCEASGGTSALCDQIIRPFGFADRSPANFPTEIRLQNLNLARTTTNGVDVEASYRMPIAGGSLGFNLVATRLLHYRQQNSPLSPVADFAGNADFIQGFFPLPLPKLRGNLTVAYTRDRLSLSVQERYIGAFHKSDQFVWIDNKVPATWYTDVSVSYRFSDVSGRPEFYLTINNLLNQKGRLFLISPVSGLNIPTSRSIYDIAGRYFTVGARAKF